MVLWWWDSFRVIFSCSFWLRVLPCGLPSPCLVQPRWMPVRRILGGGWTCGVSFWPFLNSSGWCWLISSVFLTRISCHKTSHVSCYCGAWPGWVVSVSVLPLTTTPWETSYSRYFLGIGAEVSFFCNFFLLCMGGGLPTEQKSLSTWSMSRYSLPETSIHPCNNSNLAWNCWLLSEMN